MTKHSELCQAYQKSIIDLRDYVLQCKRYARVLANGLTQYLECTENEVKLKLNESTLENSYFNFKIGVILYPYGVNSFPQREIVFHLCLKKLNSKWGIKLPDDEKLCEIAEDMTGSGEFFEQLYFHIKQNHEDALTNVLNETREKRPIGFDIVNRES